LLLVGVLLHKTSEGFAMGINLLRHKLPLRKWLALVAIFALMAPVGVAVGLLVKESLNDAARAVVSSLLNAFAVGVFMYIAILGIIVEEFSSGEQLLQKFFIVLIGVSSMACLVFLE
jgi:zinc transporter ZupT